MTNFRTVIRPEQAQQEHHKQKDPKALGKILKFDKARERFKKKKKDCKDITFYFSGNLTL